MPIKAIIAVFVMVLLLPASFTGCSSEPKLTENQQEILENCIELFTRLKVNDHDVLYENEFPYVHEERDRQEYLAFPGIAAYRVDTLLAIQLDSAVVWEGDTAYVHMKLEHLFSDSTTGVSSIRMRWWHVGDTIWIRPSTSHITKQQDFEEELRVYWDAVREMEKREQERQQEEDNQ